MISKISPRPPPVRAESIGTAVKKLAARATGYAEKSSFDGVRQAGREVGNAVGSRRETMGNFKDIKRGLRTGNEASVKIGVASTAARLNLKLPNLAGFTAWGAFGALGTALGHVMLDPTKFNRNDYRQVMHLAVGVRINDPDPSNGRIG